MAYLVEHPLAARLLADPDLAVCLKPFMKGPATVKDLAQARGISLQRAHYRVGLFLKAGLLEPVGVRRRRGRPIRLVTTGLVMISWTWTVEGSLP